MPFQLAVNSPKLQTSVHRSIAGRPFFDKERRDFFHLSDVDLLVSSTSRFFVIVEGLNVRGHRHVRAVLSLHRVLVAVVVGKKFTQNRRFVIIARQQVHVREVVSCQIEIADRRVFVGQSESKFEQLTRTAKVLIQVRPSLLNLVLVFSFLSGADSVEQRFRFLGREFLAKTESCIKVFGFVVRSGTFQLDVQVTLFERCQVFVLTGEPLDDSNRGQCGCQQTFSILLRKIAVFSQSFLCEHLFPANP